MKKIKITGVAITILGLLTVLIPTLIFKVCAAMDGKYMKCHWTAQTEVAIGIATLLLGLLVTIAKEKVASKAFAIASAINGILIILIPTTVIGVCGSPDMACNSGTRPALIIAGALVIVFAFANVTLNFVSKKDKSND